MARILAVSASAEVTRSCNFASSVSAADRSDSCMACFPLGSLDGHRSAAAQKAPEACADVGPGILSPCVAFGVVIA